MNCATFAQPAPADCNAVSTWRKTPVHCASKSSPGASMQDVVRVTYILPNAAEFEQCWPVLRKYFAEVRPAATMFSAGLADPRIRIEIQVTARKRQ